MKSFYLCLIAIAASLLMFSGCGARQPSISDNLQKSFEAMFSSVEMNSYLRVRVIKGDEHKFGSDVHILVENTSNNPIYLPTNARTLFVKVLAVWNNEWEEIKNDTIYYSLTGGEGYVLHPVESEQPNFFTNSVRPVLELDAQNENEQITVRIVVLGELIAEGERTGVPVGAYVDLFMEP